MLHPCPFDVNCVHLVRIFVISSPSILFFRFRTRQCLIDTDGFTSWLYEACCQNGLADKFSQLIRHLAKCQTNDCTSIHVIFRSHSRIWSNGFIVYFNVCYSNSFDWEFYSGSFILYRNTPGGKLVSNDVSYTTAISKYRMVLVLVTEKLITIRLLMLLRISGLDIMENSKPRNDTDL